MHKLIGVNFFFNLGWMSGTRMHDNSLPTQTRATETTGEGSVIYNLTIFLQFEILKVEIEYFSFFHVPHG